MFILMLCFTPIGLLFWLAIGCAVVYSRQPRKLRLPAFILNMLKD